MEAITVKRRGVGRPSKLTPEARKRVLDAIRAGVPYKYAAALADIGETTFYRWMERGASDKAGPYREFRQEVVRAKKEGVAARVLVIQRAAVNGDWRASLALLKIDDPVQFAVQHRHDHTGTVQLSLADALSKLRKARDQEALPCPRE